MHCTSCDQDVRAFVDLDPERGKLWRCPSPSCGAVIGPYEEPGIMTGPDGDKIDLATVQPMASAPLPRPEMTIADVAAMDPAPPVPVVLRQVLPDADEIEQQAIRRLAYVESEIERLRGFEVERDKLQAMLDALAPASGKREAS